MTAFDLLLAGGATALPWLAQSGLECDADGFVRIAPSLHSLSLPRIFAVGDCASLPGAGKSGVYAVRQGPVLAANLQAALRGEPLRDYQPQRQSLALLGWGAWSAGERLCGRWKDWLDRGFIRRHRLPD
ncbi:MAG: hypothetical protein ACRERY_20265 [Pseudomonas sp.]